MATPEPFPRPPLIAPDVLGRPSRKAATVALEAQVAVQEGTALGPALSEALRGASGLGGQERRFAATAARGISRHQRLLDLAAKALGHPPGGLALPQDRVLARYALWRRLATGADWSVVRREAGLPGPLRPRTLKDDVLEALAAAPLPDWTPPDDALERLATVHSFPRWLSERLVAPLPSAEWDAALAALDADAPLVFRVRPSAEPEEVVASLAGEGVEAAVVGLGTRAIRVVTPGTRVFETRAVRQGALQSMDLGSQLIAALAVPDPGARGPVLDACAGAGGKTLALADAAGPERRVWAADASARRLAEARRRVRELGLRNVEFPGAPDWGHASVVLLDVPCSGTGRLARDPDAKWRIDAKALEGWRRSQSELLDRALREVRGRVVYATCSVLREEDEDAVSAALARHPGWCLEDARARLPGAEALCDGPVLRLWPHRVPGAGFFAASLVREAHARTGAPEPDAV